MCVTSHVDDEIVQTTTEKAQETESGKKISRSLRVYEFKSRWRYSNDNNSIHTNRYRSIAHIFSMENMERH